MILIAAGVADPFRWQILAALLALIGLVAGGFINDYVGRRPLAICGLVAVAAFDFAAGGIAFTGLITPSQGTALAAVSIILAFVCQIAFSGSVSLLCSEGAVLTDAVTTP